MLIEITEQQQGVLLNILNNLTIKVSEAPVIYALMERIKPPVASSQPKAPAESVKVDRKKDS